MIERSAFVFEFLSEGSIFDDRSAGSVGLSSPVPAAVAVTVNSPFSMLRRSSVDLVTKAAVIELCESDSIDSGPTLWSMSNIEK